MKKGERLEGLILNSRYKNVMEFSKVADVPYTTIKSMINRDLKNASVDNVIKICKVLGLSVEDLTGERRPTDEIVGPTSDYNYYPLPISAGIPNEVDGITQAEKITLPDAVMGKHAGSNDVYITPIGGDSMNNIIPDQSLIAVKPVEISQLKDGDIVVYNYDNEYAVKRYYKQGNKVIFKPDSTDSSFFDQVINLDNGIDLKIKGKVVLYTVKMD